MFPARRNSQPLPSHTGQIKAIVTFLGDDGMPIETHRVTSGAILAIPQGSTSYHVQVRFEEVDTEAQVIRIRS